MDYLKSFVIGSSAPMLIPFYLAIKDMPERNYDLEVYPYKAALFFGGANVVSLAIGKAFGLDLNARLAVITMISILLIAATISLNKAYLFTTQQQWYRQYLLLAAGHVYAYMIAINTLERLLE